ASRVFADIILGGQGSSAAGYGDPGDVEPPAAFGKKGARRVRYVIGRFNAGNAERLRAAIDPLELGEAGQQPGRALCRASGSGADKSRGRGADARDRRLLEADLLDIDAGDQIAGHVYGLVEMHGPGCTADDLRS